MSDDLTVILTTYRRPDALGRQLDAVRNQTVGLPKQIILYQNDPEDEPLRFRWSMTMATLGAEAMKGVIVVNNSVNWGVWQRFLLAMDCDTEYVMILDDDTFPGSKWVESCQRVIAKENALLGTHGQIFPRVGRHINRRIGWPNQNPIATETDIVGSSWYFRRDWLRYFAMEPRCGYAKWGEYYHFSAAVWKHAGIRTFVPPHPAGDRELWGSTDPYAFGEDSQATFKKHHRLTIDKVHNCYLERGWKPMAGRT